MASGGGSDGCGRGAAAGLFGSFVSANTTNANGWNAYTRGMATTVTGGVTSRMMGGSFADGATTAAYGYLFNSVPHEGFWNGIKAGVSSYADGLAEFANHKLALSGYYGETAMKQAENYSTIVSDALKWGAENPGLLNTGVYTALEKLSPQQQGFLQAEMGSRFAFGSVISIGTSGVGVLLMPVAMYGNMLEAAKKGASYEQIYLRGITGRKF